MSLIVGSARQDERGKYVGGQAGDQTGKEVSTQAYYRHSKGWYVIRAKSVAHANALANAMQEACNNNKIGYDQGNRGGVITQVKKYGSLGKVAVATECDCSSLVRACIIQATGKDVGNFTTSNEANIIGASGLFEKKFAVESNTVLYNGDILVTKTKGHTVIVVSGKPRSTPKPTTSGKVLGTYEVTASSLRVRKGPGTSYEAKKKSELTEDGKKHSNANGSLLKGTRVTVKEWKNGWARTPSGWLSGDYLKKV